MVDTIRYKRKVDCELDAPFSELKKTRGQVRDELVRALTTMRGANERVGQTNKDSIQVSNQKFNISQSYKRKGERKYHEVGYELKARSVRDVSNSNNKRRVSKIQRDSNVRKEKRDSTVPSGSNEVKEKRDINVKRGSKR